MNGIMKKNFIMIALASVLMMPVSCTKNELEAPQGPAAGELTFVAYAEGGDSKTTLNEEDGSVAWAIGDQIKFDYELEKVAGEAVLSSVLAEGNIVEGAATFTAALPEAFAMSTKEYKGESRHMYVTYPASTETDYSSANEFLVTVPAEQDGTFTNASIALAKWDPANPTAPLQFYNLCGLLQIEIADDAARKIVLTSSTDIAGKMSVGFGTGVPAVKTSKNAVPVKEITVNVGGAGTYYVAVLPGELEDVYVAIYDEADALIGDRTANNAIPVARRQIRKLGTIGIGFSDRLYIKAGANGQGTSWTDAAGVDKLLATMQSTEVVTKNIYVAAGDYTIAGQAAKPSAGSIIKIYGGYPSDASGYSLAGRDVENNVSRIQNLTGRTFYTQAGNWVFDGLYFKSTGYTGANGCALSIIGATESVNVNNCHFEDCAHNSQSASIGGIVRLEVEGLSHTFSKCTFENNTSSGSCAGIFVIKGQLIANECRFVSNKAVSPGGAVYVGTSGKAILSGCDFIENSSDNYGGAVVVTGSGMLTAENCLFDSNVTAVNGGAVHFNAYNPGVNVSKFTNCKFINNKALTSDSTARGMGSAVGSAGTNYAGYVEFENCLFEGNSSYNGGALWTRTVGFRVANCSFIDNNSTNGGGTVLIDGSNAPAVYCNDCYFSYTAEANVGSTPAISINKGTFGMNNSVFAGSWGGKAMPQIANASTATIVNSTLYGQIGGGIITNSGTCCVINSIVPNAASSGKGKSVANTGTLTVDHSLYYSIDGTENLTATGSLAGVIVRKDTESNFPNDGNVWYLTDYVTMYKNDQTTKEEVSDVRGYRHYYKWTGSVPAIGESKYTKATSKEVATAVQTADADFYDWVSASLFKDIRGVSRNTTAMWPGSYEDATATAGLESLNVK